MDEPKSSFWGSLPGIFTALATCITAIGGFIVILANVGIIDFKKSETKVVPPLEGLEVSRPAKPESTEAKIPPQKESNESNAATLLFQDQLVAKYKDSGKSNLAKGNAADAVRDFEEALKLKPKDPWTLRQLAEAYKNNRQHNLALSAINQAIELEPADLHSYKMRGLLFFQNREYDKAITDFKGILEQQPNNFWALSHLADSYLYTRQPELALEAVNRAINLNPTTYAYAYRVRGRIYARTRKFPEAVADFRKSLEIEPENKLALEALEKINRLKERNFRETRP